MFIQMFKENPKQMGKESGGKEKSRIMYLWIKFLIVHIVYNVNGTRAS